MAGSHVQTRQVKCRIDKRVKQAPESRTAAIPRTVCPRRRPLPVPLQQDEKRASYEHVNRSLLHFDRKGKAYYAGDIKNGPFACFGVECPNKKIILKQQDGSYRYVPQAW